MAIWDVPKKTVPMSWFKLYSRHGSFFYQKKIANISHTIVVWLILPIVSHEWESVSTWTVVDTIWLLIIVSLSSPNNFIIFFYIHPMNTYSLLITIVLTSLYLIWLDRLRLSQIMKSNYNHYLWTLMLDQIHLWYGLIVRVIMGVSYVLLLTHLPIQTLWSSIRRGMLIGGSLYAVYNFTNLAILKWYPWQIALIDTSWGLIQWALVGLFIRGLSHWIK